MILSRRTRTAIRNRWSWIWVTSLRVCILTPRKKPRYRLPVENGFLCFYYDRAPASTSEKAVIYVGSLSLDLLVLFVTVIYFFIRALVTEDIAERFADGVRNFLLT